MSARSRKRTASLDAAADKIEVSTDEALALLAEASLNLFHESDFQEYGPGSRREARTKFASFIAPMFASHQLLGLQFIYLYFLFHELLLLFISVWSRAHPFSQTLSGRPRAALLLICANASEKG